MTPAPVDHQSVAGIARSGLNSGGRLSATPSQEVTIDAPRCQTLVGCHRFRPRSIAQAVIDGQRDDPAPPELRPTVREKRQCHAIRAARHGNRNQWFGLEGFETRHEAAKLDRAERLTRLGGHHRDLSIVGIFCFTVGGTWRARVRVSPVV